MQVKLVSFTQPSEELMARFKEELGDPDFELQTIRDLIVYCARVSNPGNQFNTLTYDKLLMYLADNKHWSPFQMCHVTLEVETTRDISHQIIRHQFGVQEFSGRYADMREMGFELRECRIQDSKNRQKSFKSEDSDLNYWWYEAQLEVIGLTSKKYQEALEKGIAKEVARALLPEGLVKTRLYLVNSIRGWIHYLQARAPEKAGAQKEHQELAKACADVISKLFPINLFLEEKKN